MKAIIVFFVVSFILAGCTHENEWYYGEWVVDETTTNEHLGEDQQNSMAGFAIAISKGIVLSVDSKKVTLSQGEKSQVMKYELKPQDDGTIILITEEKDFHLGKDDVGVFIVGVEKTSVNGEVGEVKTFNMYLMPANETP